MKNKYHYILFLFCFFSISFSQPSEELFRTANNAYEKNDFKVAIENYEKIISFGYESGELLYNLGNAYFKTGQFANALLNYERAKKYLPNDNELNHNILLANLRIPDRIESVPKIFIYEWWDKLKNIFPLSFYPIFVFLLLLFFISFCTLFLWSRDYNFRKKIFIIGSIYSIFFVIFTATFISKIYEVENQKQGIIFSQSVEIKSSPSETAVTLYNIHYGLKVKIIDQLNEWVRISLPDGKTGWIKERTFQII